MRTWDRFSAAYGTPSPTDCTRCSADGDDNAGVPDDEDGVSFGTVQVGQLGASVTVTVSNAASGARLDAWLDFNGDGSWGGPLEQIADNVLVVNGSNVLTFDVPSTAADGTAIARFRLSTAGNLGVRGTATDGEVEDHTVTISPPTMASGLFGNPNTISTADGAGSVFAADVDGDGDTDVLSASFVRRHDRLVREQRQPGLHASGSFPRRPTMLVRSLRRTWTATAIPTCSRRRPATTRSPGTRTTAARTSPQRIISITADGARSVFAADVDGDGDMDVLSASRQRRQDRLVREQRQPGASRQQVISTTADGANSVFAADVDGDGDIDVLSASRNDDKIAWYENNGSQGFTAADHLHRRRLRPIRSLRRTWTATGTPTCSPRRAATTRSPGTRTTAARASQHARSALTADGALSVFAADVDGDGDTDVLSASSSDDKIAWYENNGSQVLHTADHLYHGGLCPLGLCGGRGRGWGH